MRYALNVESDEPIMMLDKHIGFDEQDGYGIDGSLFANELLQLDAMGKKRIQVWINSVGGSVVDGYNIVQAMLKSKTKVDTYCGGIAASMAGIIFLCGRKRVMADYGILMYHNPYSADSDKDDGGVTKAMRESLNTIVCEKSGMTKERVQLLMDRTTFLNCEEAKNLGLCDEVETTSDLNRRRMVAVAASGAKAVQSEANKLKIAENKPSNKMKILNSLLGLADEAAEASAIEAIKAIQNRATAAEAKVKDLEKQADTQKLAADAVKNALVDMTKERDTLKTENDKLANEKQTAEATAKLEKASAAVKAYAEQGRIKNDEATVKAWTAKFVEDEDGIKAMLESLPLNKTAAKAPITVNPNNPNDAKETPEQVAFRLQAKAMNAVKLRNGVK